MKHCIIVRFNENVQDKAALCESIRTLFAGEALPEGIYGCRLTENCVARPNRYDLMIVVEMAREALERWDACTLHKRWKSEFGQTVASKAIFDYED